jgi:predicted dehydrogenase
MRAGVVGTGHLGFHHARILRDLVDEVIIHDTDPERMAEVSEKLGVETTAGPEELLERVDAVVVACTTSSHHDVVMRSLEAGRHVLVEKPIAAGVDQAAEMVGAAEERGLTLAVGHVERYNPAVVAAEPLISAPLFVEAHRLAPFGPRGTDVSVVMDLMIHDLDLVLSFARSAVREVHASGVPVLSDRVDIASARLILDNGAVVNLTASRISREPMRKLRFFQRDSYVSIDFADRTVEALRLREGTIVPVPVHVQERDALTAELSDFLAACRGGRPAVPGKDGLRALEVADRVVRSVRRSREMVGEGD